jgi:hypothetical protein
MKRQWAAIGLTSVVLSLAPGSAWAQFSGYFSGYYAPVNWTRYVWNNPSYDNTAFVYTGNAPSSLEVDGAVNSTQQNGVPTLPVSVIDYYITLSGSGLQPIAFIYSFSGLAAGGYDAAYLIYNNGSGFQEVANLSTLLDGTQKSYSGSFQAGAGRTFGFRVYSNNDNLPDALIISAVPEPSTLSFLILGAGTLLWNWRRRQS